MVLVIGESGAGKTSLIDSGDLRFPIDHEIHAEVNKIGDSEATRFVNWRVSGNEAILLDLPVNMSSRMINARKFSTRSGSGFSKTC